MPTSDFTATVAPGPDATWLVRHARERGADALRFLRDLVAEFGDTVHYRTAFGPVTFFNHPDSVREVLHRASIERSALVTLSLGQGLLASDGAFWRGQRNVAQPSLHPRCMEGFAPLIARAADEMMARWNLEIGAERTIDMAHELRLVTFNIIMRAMFSVDWSSHAAALCEAVGVIVEDLGAIAGTIFNLPARIAPDRNARFSAALQTMDAQVYALIHSRRAQSDAPRDLLYRFMNARDARTGAALTDVQLRDEIVSMMIAGHETTAIALAWALHLLASHPEIAQEIRAESASVADAPTLNDLPNLAHSERAFMETLRLYPPVWMMVRRATEDIEVGGATIAKGAMVLLSPYTTHRHAKFWDEPERFNPARFADSGASKRAFFPFAGGRHLCLGQRFATIEAQMILSMLQANYEFRALPDCPIEPLAALTLRQKTGVPMRVKRLK